MHLVMIPRPTSALSCLVSYESNIKKAWYFLAKTADVVPPRTRSNASGRSQRFDICTGAC
jgi:hypothetical protein